MDHVEEKSKYSRNSAGKYTQICRKVKTTGFQNVDIFKILVVVTTILCLGFAPGCQAGPLKSNPNLQALATEKLSQGSYNIGMFMFFMQFGFFNILYARNRCIDLC